MDPITHGALGGATALAIFYKHDKKNAWIVGALAAMAPDLDIFIRSSHDPTLTILYHRYFTHALSFIPLGAIIVALFLMLFKRFRVHWQVMFLAAFVGYATHGVLDACTNYGTVLLWPFSDARISWDIVSIIDPWVTVPLLLGIVWTLVHHQRQGVILGLLFVALFLTSKGIQHERALLALKTYTKQHSLVTTKERVFPKFASSHAWQGLALGNKELLSFDITTFLIKPEKVILVTHYPLFLPIMLPEYVLKSTNLMHAYSIFNWFTDGYLILVNNRPLLLADGRFIMENHPNIALWGMQFLPNIALARAINLIKLK